MYNELTACVNYVSSNSQIIIKVGIRYFKHQHPKVAYNYPPLNYIQIPRSYDFLFTLLNN